MSASKMQADELLEAWGSATARPVPPFDAHSRRVRGRSMSRALLLVTVGILILAFALGAILLTAGASVPAPTPSPSTSSDPAADFKRFEAPGITFDYPADWTDQSSTVGHGTGTGLRDLVTFGRNMSICPAYANSSETATLPPGSCQELATTPGSLRFNIMEFLDQIPGALRSGTASVIAGNPVWERPAQSGNGTVGQSWTVEAQDGGVYYLEIQSPPADEAATKADVTALLESLRSSAWEAPPTLVDDHIHLSMADGFSFDYPAGWTLYYPNDDSMMDHAVVTVASKPVLPPCSSDSCQRFTTPPDTVVVEFRIGIGPQAPDWSKAKARLGGQPAFDFGAWGPVNATNAEVGHSWGARLGRDELGVDVSIRGPDIPALQAASDQVLRSLVITPGPSPSP